MSGIQQVLLVSLVLLLFVYLRFFRNRVFNALFFFSFFLLGIVFVLRPSLSQSLATFFGVGRGVDLIFYFLFIAVFFLFIAVFQKMRHLGKTIIDLVREKAIDEARNLGAKTDGQRFP